LSGKDAEKKRGESSILGTKNEGRFKKGLKGQKQGGRDGGKKEFAPALPANGSPYLGVSQGKGERGSCKGWCLLTPKGIEKG